MKFGDYPKAGSLDGVTGFRNYVASLGLDMPCDDIVAHGSQSPLGAPIEVDGMTIGHRLAVQPMEGWDCERDGRPSENTKRRWRRFGLSGAKLIWGGEACAVRPDGRANPKQLIMAEHTMGDIAGDARKRHRRAQGGDRRGQRRHRPAAHAFRPLLQAERQHQVRVDDRLPPSAARPQVRRARRPGADERRRDQAPDRGLRRRRQARASLRLRFHRHQALPRLSGARVPERGRPSRPVWRQPGEPHALPARGGRGRPRRGAGPENRRAAVRLRTRCRSSPIRRARRRARSARASRKSMRFPIAMRSAPIRTIRSNTI